MADMTGVLSGYYAGKGGRCSPSALACTPGQELLVQLDAPSTQPVMVQGSCDEGRHYAYDTSQHVYIACPSLVFQEYRMRSDKAAIPNVISERVDGGSTVRRESAQDPV